MDQRPRGGWRPGRQVPVSEPGVSRRLHDSKALHRGEHHPSAHGENARVHDDHGCDEERLRRFAEREAALDASGDSRNAGRSADDPEEDWGTDDPVPQEKGKGLTEPTDEAYIEEIERQRADRQKELDEARAAEGVANGTGEPKREFEAPSPADINETAKIQQAAAGEAVENSSKKQVMSQKEASAIWDNMTLSERDRMARLVLAANNIEGSYTEDQLDNLPLREVHAIVGRAEAAGYKASESYDSMDGEAMENARKAAESKAKKAEKKANGILGKLKQRRQASSEKQANRGEKQRGARMARLGQFVGKLTNKQ